MLNPRTQLMHGHATAMEDTPGTRQRLGGRASVSGDAAAGMMAGAQPACRLAACAELPCDDHTLRLSLAWHVAAP
jgi:hypothetical protein